MWCIDTALTCFEDTQVANDEPHPSKSMESRATTEAAAPQTPPPSRRQRGVTRSSFVQSFYSNDSSPTESNNNNMESVRPRPSLLSGMGGGEGSDNGGAPSNNGGSFPVPRGRRLSRRASSRRLLQHSSSHSDRGSGGGGGDIRQNAAVAASLTLGQVFRPEEVLAEEDDTSGSAELMPRGGGIERHDSWYLEALRQHGGDAQHLEAILGGALDPGVAAASATAGGGGGGGAPDGFDDEEVLEQYRIMAQHEASLRVKERTGFDLREYEKKRAAEEEQNAHDAKPKAPKSRLPEPARVTDSWRGGSGGGGSTSSLGGSGHHNHHHGDKPEEAPMIRPKLNSKFIKQRRRQVPELCGGTSSSARGSISSSQEEHVVRCLGCRNANKVHVLATLVSCPDCRTVSPASSTRR